jgi:hypothetical protein
MRDIPHRRNMGDIPHREIWEIFLIGEYARYSS